MKLKILIAIFILGLIIGFVNTATPTGHTTRCLYDNEQCICEKTQCKCANTTIPTEYCDDIVQNI